MEEAQKIGGTAVDAVEDKLEFLIDVVKEMRELAHNEKKREEE